MRTAWLGLLLLAADAKRKKRKTKKQARRDLVGEFEKVLRGESVDSHVTYEDFRGQEKTMPVRQMAETLADSDRVWPQSVVYYMETAQQPWPLPTGRG